ncbi:MAG: alpha/beta fold hydrolase [Clostridiales bacterium]|nr:alpha/beta fold hydrolase [Clostridiales bacterium]
MSKALMTIHGFLTVVEDFGRLYDYLDDYDEVVKVEIPGHNGEVDFDKFTVESTQEAVFSAYDNLRSKYDEVDVVGFSMGGALATWLSAERDVHKAVLIAPANKFINVMMPYEAAKFYGGVRLQAFQEAEGGLKEKHAKVKEAFQPYGENISTANKIATERTFKYLNPSTFGVFRKLMTLSNKAVEEHSPVMTPTFILWGKLDELVPYRSIKFLLKHFKNAECNVYHDVGHSMLYTNRDNVLIADIMKFLTDGKFDKEVPYREPIAD